MKKISCAGLSVAEAAIAAYGSSSLPCQRVDIDCELDIVFEDRTFEQSCKQLLDIHV